MQTNHWLLDTLNEMESYARAHGLQGFVEGLGDVLAVYAAEAMAAQTEHAKINEKVKK